MDESNESIVRILYKRYFQEELTADEYTQLQQWRSQSRHNEEVWEQLADTAHVKQAMATMYENDKEVLWDKVLQHRRPRIVRFKYALRIAAAAVVIFAGISTYLWQQQPTPKQKRVAEVLPGSNKAVLTLADGSKVMLDSAGSQLIAQANADIRQDNGELLYIAKQAGGNDFNKLATPRGGQYIITLPDGSRVWLNAASSLRYPTAFSDTSRVVELEGEAYFEVAHQAAPFHVKAGRMNVAVLGTHFNVMAYADEKAILTTLLQGAVKLSVGTPGIVLQPGEQGVLNADEDGVQVRTVNTDEVVAWKNGYFWFRKADLPAVMRQLSRWYDIEVVYEGKLKDRQLTGKIYRNYNLSQVLSVLEENNIHFKIEDKKLIVMP